VHLRAGRPRRHPQRPDGAREGPGLPHQGHHYGPQRHPRRLRYRPGTVDGPGAARIRGVRQRTHPHHHHRAALSGEQAYAHQGHRRPGGGQAHRGHLRHPGRVRPQRYAYGHRAEAGRQPSGGTEPPVCPDPAADHVCHQYAGTGEQPAPAQDPVPAAHHRRIPGVPGGDHRPQDAVRPEEGTGARPPAGGPAGGPGQHRRGHPHHPQQLRQRQGELDAALRAGRRAGPGHSRYAAQALAGP